MTHIPADAELEAEIKAWYKALPEITLPNIDSPDGTFMELNVVDLVKFIQAEKQRLLTEVEDKLPKNEFIGLKQFKKIVKSMGLRPNSDDYKRLELEAVSGETIRIVLDEVVSVIEAVRKDLGGYADPATPTASSNQADNSNEVAA